jgi:hypothetical protein
VGKTGSDWGVHGCAVREAEVAPDPLELRVEQCCSIPKLGIVIWAGYGF